MVSPTPTTLRFLVLWACATGLSHAWIPSSTTTGSQRFQFQVQVPYSFLSTRPSSSSSSASVILFASGNDNDDLNQQQQQGNNNPLSSILSPYDSKIPPQLRDEIYAAEANTPAAQQRWARIATFALIAFLGIVLAFFNVFITELRNSPLPPAANAAEGADPLTVAGFSWVASNPITSFLFMNKLGGGICLLGGAGAGLLAEAELDTKRINSEKIFEEMERRRKQKKRRSQPTKKKRRSGKDTKRMKALSEIVEVQEEVKEVATATQETTAKVEIEHDTKPSSKDDQDEGIMGKLKGFYDKADSMAASQALLLNKKLEDEGVVEKITDETGLNVIGREEAAKLQKEKQQQSKKQETTE